MSNENNARWFVLHTYSGYENKVAANIAKIVENRGLQNLIFETRIPTELVLESKQEYDDYVGTPIVELDEDGNPKEKKEPKPELHKLFPSYVLIKMIMNDESWHVVRNIRGVTGFVGPGSKPVPLSDEEVQALGIAEVRVENIKFSVGDSVIVVAGPFAGSVVTVKEIDDENRRVKVLITFGGKESVIEMDAKDVEAVKD